MFFMTVAGVAMAALIVIISNPLFTVFAIGILALFCIGAWKLGRRGDPGRKQ